MHTKTWSARQIWRSAREGLARQRGVITASQVEEEGLYMLRPVNKTDHMQQALGINVHVPA